MSELCLSVDVLSYERESQNHEDPYTIAANTKSASNQVIHSWHLPVWLTLGISSCEHQSSYTICENKIVKNWKSGIWGI